MGGISRHGVAVCFAEEGHGNGDCGRDANLGRLAKLAFMACGDILFDIVSKRRPPETVEESAQRGIVGLVAKCVVRLTKDFVALRGFQHELVPALSLSSPESSIAKEEMPRTFNEFVALRELRIAQSGWIAEKAAYALKFVIALRNVWAGIELDVSCGTCGVVFAVAVVVNVDVVAFAGRGTGGFEECAVGVGRDACVRKTISSSIFNRYSLPKECVYTSRSLGNEGRVATCDYRFKLPRDFRVIILEMESLL